MSFILIFKNKYFQPHGLQNMWNLLNDCCKVLTDAIFTTYLQNHKYFMVYWQEDPHPSPHSYMG